MDRLFITHAENAGNLTVCLYFSDNTKQVVDTDIVTTILTTANYYTCDS